MHYYVQFSQIESHLQSTTSRYLKHLDLTSYNSLQTAITETGVNTTRRCDLTSGTLQAHF